MDAVIRAVRAMTPGSDLTTMFYVGVEGGVPFVDEGNAAKRAELYSLILDLVRRGTIRGYKRIMCFDHATLTSDPELRSGVLRVGEGPGTIDPLTANHCRLLMQTKGCSLYLAPVIFRGVVVLCGADSLSLNLEIVDEATGGRSVAGIMFFSDPPNGEIIEQFRQIERATERRMVAVREIRFSDDEPTVASSAR